MRPLVLFALLTTLTGCVGQGAPASSTQIPLPATRPASAASASPIGGPSPAASPSSAGQGPPAAAHVFLWGNPSTTVRDLQLARDAGFTWVKQRFEWRYVEGEAKGAFQWQEPDRVMNAITAQNLKVIARVDNQPKWAARNVIFPGSGPPDELRDWTDFLTALASRYRGRIHAYEIWNEPNLAREWGEKPPDPAEYTRMLQASYRAIKTADPQALVVTAGMSPTTTRSAQAMPDLDFYAGMYAAGARGSYDVLGVHAAGFKAEPCADPAQVAADPVLTNGDPSPVQERRVYAFRHVEDVRALMEAQGERDKPIGILEMGWTTDRRPGSPYAWHAVSEQQQAANLVGAFQCARQRWSDWLAFMTVIYIPEPAWTPQMEQFWWSITNPDGSPRPAYVALKEALQR